MKSPTHASSSPVRRKPTARAPSSNKLRRARESENAAGAKAPRGRKSARHLPLVREPPAQQARTPTCTACGLCCSYVAIEVDAPRSAKLATQLLWYVYHDGVSLYVNEDDWMVQFESRCQYLQPDYRCGIYATRPHICREFSEKDCEVNTGDDGHTFYTADEFLAHLQRTRPRVYALVRKGFAPPAEAARRGASPFERRFRAVQQRRAALGI